MKKIILYFSLSLVCLYSSPVFSNSNQNLGFLEPNFFLTSPLKSDHGDHLFSQKEFPAKCHIALFYKLLGSDQSRSGLYCAYTQNSYMNLYNKNNLTLYNDYQPEVFLKLDFTRWLEDNSEPYAPTVKISFSRTMNGCTDSLRRYWDRLGGSIEFGEIGKTEFYGSLSLWKTLRVSHYSKNMEQYAGNAKLTFGYWSFGDKNIVQWGCSMDLNFERSHQGFASITTSLYYNPFSNCTLKFRPALMAQYYQGTAESLLKYTKSVKSIRVGFAFL